MKSPRPNRSKALIRANVRRGAKSMRVPLVAQKHRNALHEPTICERCGAIFVRKAWRRGRRLDHNTIDAARWGALHANKSVAESTTGACSSGNAAGADREALERRVQNVASRAEFTQPERRLISMEWKGPWLEVLDDLAEARAPDRPRAQEGLRGPHVLRMVGRSDPARHLAASRGVRRKAKKALISASGKRHAASALGANSGYPVSRTFAPCNRLRPARTLNNRKPPALTGASKVRGSTSAAPESEGATGRPGMTPFRRVFLDRTAKESRGTKTPSES